MKCQEFCLLKEIGRGVRVCVVLATSQKQELYLNGEKPTDKTLSLSDNIYNMSCWCAEFVCLITQEIEGC